VPPNTSPLPQATSDGAGDDDAARLNEIWPVCAKCAAAESPPRWQRHDGAFDGHQQRNERIAAALERAEVPLDNRLNKALSMGACYSGKLRASKLLDQRPRELRGQQSLGLARRHGRPAGCKPAIWQSTTQPRPGIEDLAVRHCPRGKQSPGDWPLRLIPQPIRRLSLGTFLSSLARISPRLPAAARPSRGPFARPVTWRAKPAPDRRHRPHRRRRWNKARKFRLDSTGSAAADRQPDRVNRR